MIQQESIQKYIEKFEPIENGLEFLLASYNCLGKVKSKLLKSFLSHVLYENPDRLYAADARQMSSHFRKRAATKFEKGEIGLYNQFWTAHLFLAQIGNYLEENQDRVGG